MYGRETTSRTHNLESPYHSARWVFLVEGWLWRRHWDGAIGRSGFLGGEVQFIFPYGTYELYWLHYDSQDLKPGEAWASYVDRSASEVVADFKRLCDTTNFRVEAGDWRGIRAEVPEDAIDLIDYLWFVIYFMNEASIPMFEDWRKMMGDHLK